MTALAVILGIILILLIWPGIQRQLVENQRLSFIRQIEKKRGSRLITLIDRQRRVSLLGLPLQDYIDIDDAEEILRVIRMTPASMPIDLVIHTPGGIQLAVEQIAYGLMAHPAKVTVFVPHFAMSGGTMLALTADEIRMDRKAILGRLDPQIFGFPAVSIIQIGERKKAKDIDDQTVALIDISAKAIKRTKQAVENILKSSGYSDSIIPDIVSYLTVGEENHDDPITFDQAREVGLRVNGDIPWEIYQLLQLYPPRRRSSSVHYFPAHYR